MYALFYSNIERNFVCLDLPDGNLISQDKNHWYRLFNIPRGQQWG